MFSGDVFWAVSPRNRKPCCWQPLNGATLQEGARALLHHGATLVQHPERLAVWFLNNFVVGPQGHDEVEGSAKSLIRSVGAFGDLSQEAGPLAGVLRAVNPVLPFVEQRGHGAIHRVVLQR